MNRFLFAVIIALSGVLSYQVAQNQVTRSRAWNAGYVSGHERAQHDIAIHWYRNCLEDMSFEREHADWHPFCDNTFEGQLGFKNRWRGEMP